MEASVPASEAVAARARLSGESSERICVHSALRLALSQRTVKMLSALHAAPAHSATLECAQA